MNQLHYSGRRHSRSRKKRSRQRAGGGTVYEYSKGLLNLLLYFLSCSNLRVRFTREGGSELILPIESRRHNNQCDCFVITHQREIAVARMSAEDHYALVKSLDFEGRNVESGTPPGHIDAEILTLVAAKFAESRRANSARPQAFRRSRSIDARVCFKGSTEGACSGISQLHALLIDWGRHSASSGTRSNRTAAVVGERL